MATQSPDVQFHAASPPRPTRASLRVLLRKILSGDSDLDAFCLDHFPSVNAEFTDGMTRNRKITLLLEQAGPADILVRLWECYPREVASHQGFLCFEGTEDLSPITSHPVPLAPERAPSRAKAIVAIGAVLLLGGAMMAKNNTTMLTCSPSREVTLRKALDVLECDGRKCRKILTLESDPETGEIVVKGQAIDTKTGKLLSQIYMSRPQIAVWQKIPYLPQEAKDALRQIEQIFEKTQIDMDPPVDADIQVNLPPDLPWQRPVPPSPGPSLFRPRKDLATTLNDMASPGAGSAQDLSTTLDGMADPDETARERYTALLTCTGGCGGRRPQGIIRDDSQIRPTTPFQDCMDACCWHACQDKNPPDMSNNLRPFQDYCFSQCREFSGPAVPDKSDTYNWR